MIVSSFSGTGKSALANEFGYIFKKFGYVYWMESDLDLEFKSFAESLSIEANNHKVEDLINKIRFKLNNSSNEKFLFIFDNYIQSENFDCYVDQLSQLENVFILITTIDTNVVEKLKERFKINSKSFNLEPFSLEESENFVKTQLKEKINDENELNKFVSLFDFSGMTKPCVLTELVDFVKSKINIVSPFNLVYKEILEKKNQEFNHMILKNNIKMKKVKNNCSKKLYLK